MQKDLMYMALYKILYLEIYINRLLYKWWIHWEETFFMEYPMQLYKWGKEW